MEKELIMKDLKWMLDFKVVEKIEKEGYAEVSVKELIESTKDTIKNANETLEGIENGLFNAIGEEGINSLREGSKMMKEKAVRILDILKRNDLNKMVRFERGC